MENFFELGRYSNAYNVFHNNMDIIICDFINAQNEFDFRINDKNSNISNKYNKNDKECGIMDEETFNQYNMKNAKEALRSKNGLEDLCKQFNNAFSEFNNLLEVDSCSLNK